MTELIAALDKANMMLTSLGANNTVFLSDAKKEVYAMQKREEVLVKALKEVMEQADADKHDYYAGPIGMGYKDIAEEALAIYKSIKE